MDDNTPSGHPVPHVLDDPRDDPVFTAWLDAQEARCLTQWGRDAPPRTTTPERRQP